MRCRACDKILDEVDLFTQQEDGSEEDLCTSCIGDSFNPFVYTRDHTYKFEELSFINPSDLEA